MGDSVVRRLVGILSVLILVAWSAAPALAHGGTAVQATDPSANSPAGVIYSIPLDSARQDAAPHNSGPSNSSGVAGAVGGGTSGGGPTASGGAFVGSSAPVIVPGGQPGSLIHSDNGFGSSSRIPGLSAPASAGLGAVQSNASNGPLLAILLAVVVLALGAFAGTRAWRLSSARRRPQPPSSS